MVYWSTGFWLSRFFDILYTFWILVWFRLRVPDLVHVLAGKGKHIECLFFLNCWVFNIWQWLSRLIILAALEVPQHRGCVFRIAIALWAQKTLTLIWLMGLLTRHVICSSLQWDPIESLFDLWLKGQSSQSSQEISQHKTSMHKIQADKNKGHKGSGWSRVQNIKRWMVKAQQTECKVENEMIVGA